MKTRLFLAALFALPLTLLAANNQILGWNNLGMHCMDSDYSVFSILPPYNTIEAQLIVGGKLVTNGSGFTVTYQAVADPNGSINKSSIGKGNWLQYAPQLFGAVAADQGLPFPNTNTFWMPGASNTPQAMIFESSDEPAVGVFTPVNWFHAYGIPLTPYDDAGKKNPYPIMRQIGWSGTAPIATNDIVLPVSDEMDCRACHASGSVAAAQPAAGWVWSGIPERDFRLNILRLHDEHQFTEYGAVYRAALATNGFNPQGLYRGVVADHRPVLCAACHASEALGGGGIAGIPPLTESVHKFHAHVIDPVSNTTLDSAANRSACYRCHPGSATKCLRGAMGGAIAADGSMEMQCQSCHGNMSTVGTPFPQRIGWFMEPNCASCHTGTATSNTGQIRYPSVFTDTNFTVRAAVNQTFATQSNTPTGGLSLYRFSAGHGGLQCSACHGSTHAEFPATHVNDNVRNIKIQGHAGVMIECTACHTSMPANTNTATAGPHGMHPISSSWAGGHNDILEQGHISRTKCQACHGGDYRGTVLSRAQNTNSFTVEKFGTKNFWRGRIISCYDCHDGGSSSNPSSHPPATVAAVATNTVNSAPVAMTLPGSDPASNPLAFRIVSQPGHGAVAVSNNLATYLPEPGFVGTETFTFAAYNGWVDSNLATGTVAVAQGPFSIGVVARVPANSAAGWPVAFGAVPSVTNYAGPLTFTWDFGDGSAPDTQQFPAHVYSAPGTYLWGVTATAGTATASTSGSLLVTTPVSVNIAPAGGNNELAVIQPAGTVLEESLTVGPGALWTPVTNLPSVNGVVTFPPAAGSHFYRTRQAW